jgi:HEAT repeat protein
VPDVIAFGHRACRLAHLAGLVVALGLLPRAAAADELEVLMHRIVMEPKEALDPVINRLVFLDSADAAGMVAGLLENPRPSVRSKAAWVLGFLDAPATEPALRRALTDPDWEVRRDAVYALGRLGATGAAATIADRLADSSRPVRLEAARVLGVLKEASVAEAVRRALERAEDDAPFEVALVTTLGAIEDAGAVGLVRGRLRSRSEEVRLAALRTLARLGDPDAREELLGRLADPDRNARRDAALLLADVPSTWAREALRAALADPEPRVGIAAAEALARQSDEAGVRHLAAISATADDPRLSLAAAEALGRLDIRSDEIAALRRRIALERLTETNLPPERLAADLFAFGLSFTERLLALSARFHGVPYMESPLGEGAGIDPDPLYRWDGVDCLTYVEQVLALTHARRPEEMLPVLLDLRYQDGRVAYGERNHLMEHQWLPHNVAKGWLRDITREVGGDRVKIARKEITAESWARRRGVSLALEADEIPLGVSELPIIPLDVFPEVMDRIPEGAILVVVRNDFPSRPIRVTHLGFVVEARGRPHLRHAARASYMRVIDEDLSTFVRRNAGYRSWPVTGFHLLLPVENADRVDALGGE